MLALLGLSILYVAAGSTELVIGLFAGLAPAVIAIVVQAVQRVGKRALHHRVLLVLAIASFLALTVLHTPFPLVVLAAGLLGWILGTRLSALRAVPAHGPGDGPPPLISDDELHHDMPSAGRALSIVVVGLLLWFTPVVLASVAFGRHSVFVDQGLFFSGAAVVTFGGAYAVLTYVAQQAVNVFHWLTPSEMVNGLALAETTPGPLIMVVQFVAFLGAYRNPGALDPWVWPRSWPPCWWCG
jgi:chromate transporter